MINNKKLVYEMKNGKFKHYQPCKKSINITDVMKQTDKNLIVVILVLPLTDAQG